MSPAVMITLLQLQLAYTLMITQERFLYPDHPPVPIKAIIFDLDDTLLVDVDVSHEAFDEVAKEAQSRFGVEPSLFTSDAKSISQSLWEEDGECRSYCESIGISPFECLWGAFTGGDSSDLNALRKWAIKYRVEVFKKTLDKQGKNGHPEAARFLSDKFAVARRSKQRLMIGAREVLLKLACTYDLALLTNGAPDLQREKIATSGLESLFKVVTVSGELEVGKPHPAIFHQVLAKLGVSSLSAAVMIGNSLERDIAGARNTGIRCIWLHVPGAEEYTLDHTVAPDRVAVSLLDIPAILSEMEMGNS
jgi:putative hydrolase of the HAD superfamily